VSVAPGRPRAIEEADHPASAEPYLVVNLGRVGASVGLPAVDTGRYLSLDAYLFPPR
jgi:hypothetical protein